METLEAFYDDIEKEFLQYIDETSRKKFICARLEKEWYEESEAAGWRTKTVVSLFDYCHRWSRTYCRRFYFRLHLLENWYRWLESDVTFLTITTRQDMTIPGQILFLKGAFRKLVRKMHEQNTDFDGTKIDKLRRVSYLAAMDFHQSGYAHYHIIFFHRVPEKFQKWSQLQWGFWGFGSPKNGLAWRKREAGEVQHLVRYLFKHAGKVFSGKDRPGWLRFHAVVHYMQDEEACAGVRFFHMSKDVAKVMRMPEKEGHLMRVVDERGRVYATENIWSDNQADEHVRRIEKYLNFFEDLKV